MTRREELQKTGDILAAALHVVKNSSVRADHAEHAVGCIKYLTQLLTSTGEQLAQEPEDTNGEETKTDDTSSSADAPRIIKN